MTTPRAPNRPNKLARGMQRTCDRSGHTERLSPDALRLCVLGSLDRLARLVRLHARRLPCPCCGGASHGRFGLNDLGRSRLAALRARRACRLAAPTTTETR